MGSLETLTSSSSSFLPFSSLDEVKGLAENIFKIKLANLKNEFSESEEIPDWVKIEESEFIKVR